jgi:hypothetical protein
MDSAVACLVSVKFSNLNSNKYCREQKKMVVKIKL